MPTTRPERPASSPADPAPRPATRPQAVGARAAAAALAAMALVGFALGGLAPSTGAAPGSSAAPALATPRGVSSSCRGSGTTTVVTDTIRQCEETEIVVRAEAVCSSCPGGLNLIFVVPDYADDPNWLRGEVQSVLGELKRVQDDEDAGIEVRVGVVQTTIRSAATRLRLTDRILAARGDAVSRSPAQCPDADNGCACYPLVQLLDASVSRVARMFDDERKDANLASSDPVCEYIVLFSEGRNGFCNGFNVTLNASRNVRAARSLDRDGRLLLVGCPSTNPADCDGPRQMARSPRYYFEAPRGGMRSILRNEFDRLVDGHLLRDVEIVQRLPVGIDYVVDSASVPPSAVDVGKDGTVLRWRWERIGVVGPHEVRYRVAPAATGAFTVTGSLEIVDFTNRKGHVDFDPARVFVSAPCVPSATPTPTASATPTASDTPTPSATPTATSTPTATATPTRVPSDLYLPIALGEACNAERRAADIALVIDASTSMLADIGDGRSKMAAALAAASRFLGQLSLANGRDRAAIVAFNAEARILQPLTVDRAALDAALAAIVPAQQTCLPCAVEQAEAALDLGAISDRTRTKTIVLLTDGRSNPRPASEAVDLAQQAKARGVLIFTVGIGHELDVEALRAMASQPDYFFQSPNAQDLEQIYTVIADLIPCPTFWPVQP